MNLAISNSVPTPRLLEIYYSFPQAPGRGAVRGQVDRVHDFSGVDRVAELHPLPVGEEFEGGEGSVAADSRVVPRVDSLLVAVVLP